MNTKLIGAIIVVIVILAIAAYYMFGSKFVGCYKDSANRVLPEGLASPVTLSECQKLAQQRGLKYYGLEWANNFGGNSGQCWAGNKINDQGPATNCTKDKSGNTVGGDWSIAVYKT
jgi:hypothetical protein